MRKTNLCANVIFGSKRFPTLNALRVRCCPSSRCAIMASFNVRFQRCLESTLATFEHGIAADVVAELEALKPGLGNLAQDDACLRAWKKIEKVYF